MPKKNVIAVIPARGNSKTIPGKNYKKFNGKPIIANTIEKLKRSRIFDRIIVSTDSKKIASISKKYGAEIPFLRPKEISNDASTDNELYEFLIKFLDKKKIIPPDFFAHLSPTAPIRLNNVIKRGVEYFFRKKKMFESMRSVSEMSQPSYKTMRIIDGKLCSIIKKDFDLNKLNMPRQLYQKTYIPNGLIDIFSTKSFLKNKSTHGKKVLPFIVDQLCVDIDNKNDFEYASFLIKRKKLRFKL